MPTLTQAQYDALIALIAPTSRPRKSKAKSTAESFPVRLARARAEGPVCIAEAHGGTCGKLRNGRFTPSGAAWHAEHRAGEFAD